MKADKTSTQRNSERPLELTARRAIEQQGGGALDDKAWKQVRDRLIEFVLMLQQWDDRQKIASSVEKKEPCKKVKQPAA
jgi:hypothetical protein